jgi:hypothetical protein
MHWQRIPWPGPCVVPIWCGLCRPGPAQRGGSQWLLRGLPCWWCAIQGSLPQVQSFCGRNGRGMGHEESALPTWHRRLGFDIFVMWSCLGSGICSMTGSCMKTVISGVLMRAVQLCLPGRQLLTGPTPVLSG